MSENKIISIQTITPTYDKVEDRIRLSINYQDVHNRIDLMVTRSFLLQILPAIEEYIYQHYPNEEIQDEVSLVLDDIEENTQNSNLSQTVMEDLVLYQKEEDLLITINLSFDKDTTHTTLQFVSKKGYKAIMAVDSQVLNNILKSIKSAIPSISWGISGYF